MILFLGSPLISLARFLCFEILSLFHFQIKTAFLLDKKKDGLELILSRAVLHFSTFPCKFIRFPNSFYRYRFFSHFETILHICYHLAIDIYRNRFVYLFDINPQIINRFIPSIDHYLLFVHS